MNLAALTAVLCGVGGAVVVVITAWLLGAARRGFEAQPTIKEGEHDLEVARADLARQQGAPPSPGVLLDVMRELDGEPR